MTCQRLLRFACLLLAGGLFLFLAGSASAVEDYTNPVDLASDQDGSIWFAAVARQNNQRFIGRLGKVTTKGAIDYPKTKLSSKQVPVEITSDGRRGLWVLVKSSTGVYAIVRLRSDGTVRRYRLPSESVASNSASSLVSGRDGSLWFVYRRDPASRQIRVGHITLKGKRKNFVLKKVSELRELAVGPDNKIWFSGSSSRSGKRVSFIGRLTAKGKTKEFRLPGTTTAASLVAGPDGNIWFADSDHAAVGRLRSTGEVTLFTMGLSADARLTSIIKGSDNNLWLVDNAHDYILRLSTEGLISQFDTDLRSAFNIPAIAPGTDGSVWFAEKSVLWGAAREMEYSFPSGNIGRLGSDGQITHLPL